MLHVPPYTHGTCHLCIGLEHLLPLRLLRGVGIIMASSSDHMQLPLVEKSMGEHPRLDLTFVACCRVTLPDMQLFASHVGEQHWGRR